MFVTQDYKNVTLTRDERRLMRSALYVVEGDLLAAKAEQGAESAAFWQRKLDEVRALISKVTA